MDGEVRIVSSIAEADAAAWDRLASGNPLLRHGWLALVEREWREPVERRYLLVERSGRLVAAAACYVDARSGSAESIDDLVFGRWGSVFSLRPALVCGFPWSVGSGCIFDPELEPSERERLARLLAAAVTQAAGRAGQTPCFVSVAGCERELRAGLRACGYRGARHEPMHALDVHWPDFESYWRSLSSANIRKNIRREMNKCRKQGVEIATLEDPAGCAEDLHRIVNGHFRRYGWPRFPYGHAWFCSLKRELGENAVITVARQQGLPVGVAVSLRAQGTRQMILACVDHAAEGGNLTHFNLAYYRGLEDCIASGDRRYVVGPGQHVSRTRRGFRPAESLLYVRAPGRLRQALLGGWLTLLEYWLRRKRRAEGT